MASRAEPMASPRPGGEYWAAAPSPLRVVSAREAAAADAAAVAAGIPARALMQRAGAAAAAEVALRYPARLARGVLIAAGGGNNGGDGWTIAAALHAAGVRVRVVECVAARSAEARAERAHALAAGVAWSADPAALGRGSEEVIVDALLGTGYRPDRPLPPVVDDALRALAGRVAEGAILVAADVPSALDATTGRDGGSVTAHLTLSFGTLKRGQLVARERCGALVVLDIGLGPHAATGLPLVTRSQFDAALPPLPASAHKGTRRRVAIVGGAAGMAGAAVLAARAALRSGAGLVACHVEPTSRVAVQEAEPAALAGLWPENDDEGRALGEWADVVLLGPGLGRSRGREIVDRVLRGFAGPVVLDADALTVFADDVGVLRTLLGSRPALLTPHPAEFARLAGSTVTEVLDDRFEAPARLARDAGATVLLKGTPTVVASPAGASCVVAEGTPILATGGAGDVLGGIAATLLAHTGDPFLAGVLAAFAHGRAALEVSARATRGYTLDDVLRTLPAVWTPRAHVARPPILGELPAVGEHG